MKNFTSVSDVSDVSSLIEKGISFKKNEFQADLHRGRSIGLIFLNPSLRTRLSSIRAAQNLGIEPVVLDLNKDGWAMEFQDGVIMNGNKAEHIKEAAAVMGSYFDVLAVRTFPTLHSREEDYAEKVLASFKKYAGVPIISLESATLHPLQSLADMITISENWTKKEPPKVVFTWAPHIKALPQAVPNSFVEWAKFCDFDLSIVNPKGYNLAPQFTNRVNQFHDQSEAMKNADFVYVKNWSAYEEYGQVLNSDPSWRFGKSQWDLTNQAKVMHCLPVRRGVVMEDEILDSPHAIHLMQAKNRIYAAQAVFDEILSSNQ